MTDWQQNSNPFTRNFNVAPTIQVPLLRRDAESGELELAGATLLEPIPE